jgi:hypothetical protein
MRAMKHTILFLAANPADTAALALDEECRAIERELQRSTFHDELELRSRWAVDLHQLMRHLNELEPEILHFSGHGTRGGVRSAGPAGSRDIDPPLTAHVGGIVLQTRSGSEHVSGHALARMIETASPSTSLVVLNACYSASIADSLASAVGCVVGMDGAIEDRAARSFAVTFYLALGHRRSIGNAAAQAIAVLEATHSTTLPVCRVRDGLDADQLFLRG